MEEFLFALLRFYAVSNRVLNTDNMSIVGATIDYGPYGFMDNYDPEFICNGSGKRDRHQNSQFITSFCLNVYLHVMSPSMCPSKFNVVSMVTNTSTSNIGYTPCLSVKVSHQKSLKMPLTKTVTLTVHVKESLNFNPDDF